MTRLRNTLVLTGAFLATTFVASMASAGGYNHIDQLALRLQKQTAQLKHEFQVHYRHAAHYPHLISDASQMYALAAHIHEVAHHHGSALHLRNDLEKLDRLFHHVEGLVEHINHDAYYGHGHLDGNVGHVRHEMAAVSNTLHHLKSDINAVYRTWYYSRYGHRHRSHGYTRHGGHRGHGVHGGHGGITFSRGGFSISIGH